MRQNRDIWRVRTPKQLGAALRSFRRQSNLTQEQLAEQLGIHRRVLARLESGEATKQLRLVLRLLEALSAEIRLEQYDAATPPQDVA